MLIKKAYPKLRIILNTKADNSKQLESSLFDLPFHHLSQFTVTMVTSKPKKFATDLSDYAARRGTTGPYADDLDVDVLIVGAGFGKLDLRHLPPPPQAIYGVGRSAEGYMSLYD